MKKAEEYFRFLVEEIHTTVVATVDEEGLPVTAAIDMMDWDDNGLYFLTAKGKSFYDRLKIQQFLALTAIKGESTKTSVAVSVRGKVRELGYDKIPELFEKNPYMKEIYPTEESMVALTAFHFEATLARIIFYHMHQIGIGGLAVDGRLADAQHIQIWAVQDKQFHFFRNISFEKAPLSISQSTMAVIALATGQMRRIIAGS